MSKIPCLGHHKNIAAKTIQTNTSNTTYTMSEYNAKRYAGGAPCFALAGYIDLYSILAASVIKTATNNSEGLIAIPVMAPGSLLGMPIVKVNISNINEHSTLKPVTTMNILFQPFSDNFSLATSANLH